ncbi:MAG: hypothetical protein IPI98_00010 [Chitinophagaceae bacterium]|nr:hypothetical protein [Chitinophagaceae bacterium]
MELKSDGLSGFAENKYKYNACTELNEELDVQYYETPLRNYDPQTGRFNCVDILAEHYFALTPYQYGFNNPVFFNDPTGALTKAEFDKLIETLWGSNYGGHWSAKENTGTFEYGGGSYSFFGSADEAFGTGAGLMADNGWWGLNKGWVTNFESALQAYNGGKFTPGMVTGYYMQKWESQQAYNISSDYSPNGKGFNTVYNTEYIGTMENVLNKYTSYDKMMELFAGNKKSFEWTWGLDMALGAAETNAGNIIKNRYIISWPGYGPQPVQGPVTVKLPIGKTFDVSRKVLNNTAGVLKWGGRALGVAGIVGTGIEIYNGEKSLIGEGGLDLIMGGVGFIPGGGWIVSGAYFGGKALLEWADWDFWNN